MESAHYADAIDAFSLYENYQDSKDKIAECRKLMLEKAKNGDTVTFGTYYQYWIATEEKSKIEWIVLEKEGDKVLLISKYILEQGVYLKEGAADTLAWETSSIRSWLNSDFLNEAFTEEEREQIIANPDKVRLLSDTEAEKYFTTKDQRIAQYNQENSKWLLMDGAYVVENGNIYQDEITIYHGLYHDSKVYFLKSSAGVRPVIWLDITG